MPGAQLEPDRRTLETKSTPKAVYQVAAITTREAGGLIPVNHDRRGTLAALMRVAELDSMPAHDRWGMGSDRLPQNLV